MRGSRLESGDRRMSLSSMISQSHGGDISFFYCTVVRCGTTASRRGGAVGSVQPYIGKLVRLQGNINTRKNFVVGNPNNPTAPLLITSKRRNYCIRGSKSRNWIQ